MNAPPGTPPPVPGGVVVDKTYDLVLWLVQKVEKFPKSYRFSVGQRLVEQRPEKPAGVEPQQQPWLPLRPGGGPGGSDPTRRQSRGDPGRRGRAVSPSGSRPGRDRRSTQPRPSAEPIGPGRGTCPAPASARRTGAGSWPAASSPHSPSSSSSWSSSEPSSRVSPRAR